MIALLPLDNRPCNTRFPQQIAAIGGASVHLPDAAQLGFFNSPGSPANLAHWLHDLPDVSALIVSVDMLAYGGLVASRRPNISVEDALERLDAVRQWHKSRPATPIYAFNVLMRLAITMDGDAAVQHYYNVMRYARLADEAERFDSDYLREELQKVTAEIPPELLQSYLAARARNHAVNCRMIEWLDEGVFDYLLITQEDATEWGLHRREQDELLGLRDRLNVGAKMSLHPGADEAALTLLARHWNTGAKFCVHASDATDFERIAPFEDRPYHLALTQHVAAMRGQLEEIAPGNAAASTCSAQSDAFELFINAPVGGSQHDEKEDARAARRTRIAPWLDELQSACESGARVALCDVAFPNGADNLLMTELEKRRLLGKLTVFGGWNTAGNTTGTVLAQCAALTRIERVAMNGDLARAHKLSRQFLFERLVDDWFYQARVRAQVERDARKRGVSPLRMSDDDNAGVEAQTRRELSNFAQILAHRHFPDTPFQFEVHLPWRRTFEVAFHAEPLPHETHSELVEA